jgi:hypothetical protein
MKPDCRNDCIEPLLFPKRIYNRPGLSHIDYRIGTYADFREALLRNLNKVAILAAWTHREPDDPAIALLEGAAILSDILTFYQEIYANEAFLRTAQWRESIADLVRLVGHHLSPGVGGKATFAFGVRGDKPVVVPAGFPVKAQVTGLDKPAEFETVKEFVAEPTLSQFYLYRPSYHPDITNGTKKFAIATSDLSDMNLKLNEGDRLMLVASSTNPQTARQIVVVENIRELLGETEITIEGSWQGGDIDSEITAYKLGRSFRHFGYNAPPKETVLEGSVAVQKDVDFRSRVGEYPEITYQSSPQVAFVYPIYYLPNTINSTILSSAVYTPELPNLRSFPLDSEVADISIGSTMLVSLQFIDDNSPAKPTYFFERKITKVSSASGKLGAITGGTTVVELDKEVALALLIYTDIRSVEFQEVIGEKFILKSVRKAVDTADKSQLYYDGDADSYKKLDRRSLLLTRDGQSEQVVITIHPSNTDDKNRVTLRKLTLNPSLSVFELKDFPLENPNVTVYGNLIEATQGNTEKEAILGNGDSRQAFQTFKLPKSSLTYLNSVGETPPEVPELQIYVNDRLWRRVPSFFNRGSQEEIYIVQEDANGESWVQFGDGKTGSRLPSGIKNVIAKYRTGIGAHGALQEETTVQAGGKLERLEKIWLPGVVSGGSQPETGENAKQTAPGKIQSLGRLVSLQDYESETLAIGGVAKVSAAWQLVDNIPCVVLTILMATGREKEADEVERIVTYSRRCPPGQRGLLSDSRQPVGH